MPRINFIGCWTAAAWIALSAGAAGQVPPHAPRSDTAPPLARQEAEALRQDIRRQEAEVDLFERDESDIAAALESAGRALQRYRRQAAALQREIAEIGRNIASTEVVAEDLQHRIRTGEANRAQRLVALYKTHALGIALHPFPADSLHAWLQRRRALEQISAYDERLLRALLAHHADLQRVQDRLERQRGLLRQRLQEQEAQFAGAARESANREHLLAQIRSRKELQRAVLENLKQAAAELDQAIDGLSLHARSETHRPPIPFAEAKGLLIFPVKGKIVKKFGPFNHSAPHVQAYRGGVEIAADRGEPVRAVHAGRVVYAGWFKGYGNVLIIDHGQHYYTVHAFLEDLFIPVGSPVDAGDVVATVGDSGTMGSSVFYFELRHRDTPLDPLEWFKQR
ncbi:MAG: peptidoglycan DD-metalloendopeptidase family protein [Desulfobacterales bacterium]|jgi:septal ring factor EnvC (AmiA/AmiB activator)|nr:peptidoglycan DD-metalloendopeptidase family protein [Desulfobacterales bacterium]